MENADKPDLFQPGDKFRGYVVERLLGKGGIGAVYLVRHEMLDTLFALKALYPETAGSGDYVERFMREAKLATRIRHPNLVAVHDCGYDEERGLYFRVMDYVLGGDLRSAIGLSGTLDHVRAAAVVRQVASALAAARPYGVVHRDIKPENIMVQPDGSIKLVDLGIAKASNLGDTLKTMAHAMFGTPAYISPEQAQCAANVDVRADVYSLGIVYFEMLTGHPPYEGKVSARVLMRVISDEPIPDVRTLAPDVPEGVAALIARMVAKKAEDRIADFDEVLTELDRLGYTSVMASVKVEYAPAAEDRTAERILAQDADSLPENNATLSFDTEDKEIQAFVAEMKRKRIIRKLIRHFGWSIFIILIGVAVVALSYSIQK